MRRSSTAWLTCSLLLLSSLVAAEQVQIDASLADPMLLAGKKQTTYLNTTLQAFKMTSSERAPVNVALVLDKSGSMKGEKIDRAKEAAIRAIDRLGKDDIVSVIVYDSTVQVLVPATKLRDKQTVQQAIRGVRAAGSTALFAGVSKGAKEIRKFLESERVNRIILLSDGKANVGPQSPSELAQLGRSLAKENITVSTLGLGLDYNEDLMTKLANAGEGNHVFIEDASQMAGIFNAEFDDVLSVVAQEVTVTVTAADGIRPVRVIGRDAEINGQQVVVQLAQLYSEQEKYVMLELEVPAGKIGVPRKLAKVEVVYANMQTKTTDRLTNSVSVNFSRTAQEAQARVNRDVMERLVLQVANERSQLATKLRDQGDIIGCQRVLAANGAYLTENAEKYNSKVLARRGVANRNQSILAGKEAEWSRLRKVMREHQYEDKTQQRAR